MKTALVLSLVAMFVVTTSALAHYQIQTGNSYGESLYGHEHNDRLDGLGGDDKLEGRDGDDELYGGGGHDRLYGQYGRDYLKGGPGNDQLFGGRANDDIDAQDGMHDYIDCGAGDKDVAIIDLNVDSHYRCEIIRTISR